MAETEATAVAAPTIEDWTQTPWRKLERYVYRLQKRIYKAQARGNVKAVHSLQRLLMKSRAARMLAVRRVTQDNHGKKTAGVDGVKAVGPMVRLLFVAQLRTPDTITAQPVRRVLIPKPGKNEKRKLGIPVMLDRAHQALVKLALEPQWEARFEPHNYGFRPGRSTHDAIEAIFTVIAQQSCYALDADIKGCFDGISHWLLLSKLDTTPAIYRAVKAWLSAGVLHDGVFTSSTSGTPQGGVASPLLANIALHGLETCASQAYRRPGAKGDATRPRLIRFADDFVILCPDLDGITAARQAIEQFLDALDLHLSPTKTRVTHTFHLHEGSVGFDFLGFTVRQYARGIRHCGKNWRGERLGFKTLIKPSKDAIMRHTRHLDATVRHSMQASQEELIERLNPIIRGWANYYRTVVAAATFHRCDSQVYWRLRSWAIRRHPLKGRHWITRHYWNLSPGAKWDFVVKQDGAIVSHLRRHTQTHIRRHIQVRGNASPYDGNLRYWATRLHDHPLTGTTLGRLLRAQQGACASCGLLFTDTDVLEIDHIIPISQGGSERLDNKQVLHRHCHDQKPTGLLVVGTTDKDHMTEEPDKAKVLCPVLQGGGRR